MLTLSAPAKLNLFLAVTGLRADGFHNLVSCVAPLSLHDTLSFKIVPEAGPDYLHIENSPGLLADASNTVLKAIQCFRKAHAFSGRVEAVLAKKIPFAAGLGGGSSDAVATLKGLNTLLGGPLSADHLMELAAQIGSDCPLFLYSNPSLIRGRGEVVTPVSAAAAEALQGQRLYLFKPDFSIETPWAYGQLKATQAYTPPLEAEAALATFLAALEAQSPLHFTNDFLKPLAFKYPLLSLFLDHLRQQGFACGLSGSGSACFVWLNENTPIEVLEGQIVGAFGPHCFRVETRIQCPGSVS